MIKVITTTSDFGRTKTLRDGLEKYGWDYHVIEHEWKGFNDKIHETYKYLKSLSGYDSFIYVDAWDTICFGKDESVLPSAGLLFSTERACYPHPEKAVLYPSHPSPWHFVNGGGWGGSIDEFLKMYETTRPESELNDQVYLTDRFLSGLHKIELDYDCRLFQTIAFCPESDFIITDKVRNMITGSFPLFIHGNGHTPLDRFTEKIY